MARLDRVIVVGLSDGRSWLDRLFGGLGRPIPDALSTWEVRVDHWCDEYRARSGAHRLIEIFMDTAIFIFDQHEEHERVVLAYGISTPPIGVRNKGRIRRFPDVNVGVRASLGDDASPFDRGHLLSHASGGELDINLFPHERALNQGRSDQGKKFRALETLVASRPGTFHFHRPIYDDSTWIPSELEYGLLRDDTTWTSGRFSNRGTRPG